MIQLTVLNGRTVAMIVCDVCDMQIDNARMAMVRWRRDHDRGDGEVIDDLTFCHKGTCDKECSVEHGDDPWMELEHFLIRLVLNSGMDMERVQVALGDVEDLQRLP